MKHMISLMIFGFLSLNCAMADEWSTTYAPDGKERSPTQQWLELQRSGKSASTHPQPLSGEAMDRVHKRYLKSFEQPIPAFDERETTSVKN